VIRSLEFDLETRSPNDMRFASKQGQMAASAWAAKQRAEVRKKLVMHFGAHVPGRFVQNGCEWRPNRIEVRFTRIAHGSLDPEENLPMAFKHVKDEVAEWCGFKNDRDPIFTWRVPYGQEKAPPHVQRVRIEIEDLTPGTLPPVILREMASEGRANKARIESAVRAEQKRRAGGVVQTGRVLSYQPEAAARGASSAARDKADEAFARLTGADMQRLGWPTMQVAPDPPRPTALDLRDAAERVLSPAGTSNGARSRGAPQTAQHGAGLDVAPRPVPPRDPGEERAARDLAPCTTCSVHVGEACDIGPGERVIYGVHVARAIAAKLPVLDDDRASLRPARAPTNGVRKAAAQRPMPVYVRLPWEQRVCGTCDGAGAALDKETGEVACCWTCDGALTVGMRLRPADIDGPTVVYRVPPEHVDRFGPTVTLTRRRHESARTGVCWLYE
jgi:hypothetical protein